MRRRARPVSEQEPTISSDLTVTATTRDAISSTQWIRSISTCDPRWIKKGERAYGWFLGVNDLDLPLAIDIEEWGNPENCSTDKVVESIRGMIFALEGCRHKVILYTNKRGYERFVRGRLDEMPVWVCSFTNPPITTDNWTLWQHSHESHIDGIKGKVDLNTFNGDSLSWETWLDAVNNERPTRLMQ